jgi:hypothetical protein
VDELDLRASDSEREATVTELRRHLVDGRLTMDEFDERSGEALRARTRRELTATLRELPARVEDGRSRAVRQAERATTVWAALPALLPVLVVTAVVALAAVSGGWWLLWLIWPALALTRGAAWRRAGYGHYRGYGSCGGHRHGNRHSRSDRGYTIV